LLNLLKLCWWRIRPAMLSWIEKVWQKANFLTSCKKVEDGVAEINFLHKKGWYVYPSRFNDA
jgi:hypothetical protein